MAIAILLRRNRTILAINEHQQEKLTTPTNIEVDNSTVSFEADEHATSFEFVIDNTSWGDVANTERS